MQHATANAVHRPFNTFPYSRKMPRYIRSNPKKAGFLLNAYKPFVTSTVLSFSEMPAHRLSFMQSTASGKRHPPPSPRKSRYTAQFSACGSIQGKWKAIARPQRPVSPQTSAFSHDAAFSPSAGRFWRVRMSLFSESTSL